MTLDFPDWDEMAAEPEKLVGTLQEGLTDLQGQVRLMRERGLETARRLVEVKADVDYLSQHKHPAPKEDPPTRPTTTIARWMGRARAAD